MTSTQIQILLAVALTTLFGGVIGYCLATLRAKKQASSEILSLKSESLKNKQRSERDLTTAHRVIEKLRDSTAKSEKTIKDYKKREDTIGQHAQRQALRITTLESQVAAYEEQQIRLQSDFASYKSTKARELELARINLGRWSESDKIPVLNNRISEQQGDFHDLPTSQLSNHGDTNDTSVEHSLPGLSFSLSKDVDIPALEESELPDYVDELEFAELEEMGEQSRG